MANKLYEESYIQDIADAIREKNGTSNTYLVSQMGDAVRAIAVGSSVLNSGVCGESVYWKLYDNGMLYIYGQGQMYDYTVDDDVDITSPFYNINNINCVVIANGVTSIGNYAFFYCPNLESAVIFDSVTSIGISAFSASENLTSIILGNSITTISYDAFGACRGLKDVLYKGTKEEWDKISIGSYNDLLLSATLHCEYSATTDSDSSQQEQEINYPTIIQNGSYEILPDDGYTISKVTVEVDVPTEGGLYDEMYTKLINGTVTDVVIPTGCTAIRSYAFYNCTTLRNVVISDSVTRIDAYAFRGCTGLTTVNIPSSVRIIDNYAFYNCTKITDMYCYSITPPTLNNSNAIPAYATIHIPIGSGDAYKSATNWSSLASKIVEDIIIE